MDWLKIMQHRYRLTGSDFITIPQSERILAKLLVIAYLSFLICTEVFK